MVLLMTALCLFIVYPILLVLYRLFFSPLAKFPGPKLAAATLWYEFYYDVYKRGRYTFKLADLHAQYGPIIRISPYELHVNDPEYYDELYVGPAVRRSLKYEWSVKGFGPTDYIFATAGHDLHRARRGAVAPFFSKSMVQRFEPEILEKVKVLIARLNAYKGTGAIVNLVNVYPCLTSDIICQYAFASPYGYLDMPEFAPLWHAAVMDASEGSHFFKQFPWIESLMRRLPQAAVKRMAPNLGSLFLLGDMIHDKVAGVRQNLKQGKSLGGQRTIFHDLMVNEQLPAHERSDKRLEAEGFGLVGAGAMTVALTLSVVSYHVIANPKILETLRQEVGPVLRKTQSAISWNQLEQLPYLSAVIQEGLRMAYGVSHRLQRISPDVDLQYKTWVIPRGTPVGMTSVLLHNNEDVFRDPKTFDPQRWLQKDSAQLRKYIVAFGKGSRQCLGMNLAYCELYLTLALVFTEFDFALYETDVSDAEVAHDFFNACQSVESKGIRVKID